MSLIITPKAAAQVVQAAAESGGGQPVLRVAAKRDRDGAIDYACLLYTSPSPRDRTRSRMPSSA